MVLLSAYSLSPLVISTPSPWGSALCSLGIVNLGISGPTRFQPLMENLKKIISFVIRIRVGP